MTCAARRPSSVWVGGIRTSTITASGACSSTARRSASPSSASPTTSNPARRTSDGDALAHQQVVVGDHDSHGSSAIDDGPARRGARDPQVPGERLDAVLQPAQAGPTVTRAPPTPSSAISIATSPSRRESAHRRGAGLRVPGHVGQRLAGHEVERELDRAEATSRVARTRPRWAPPSAPRATSAPARARAPARRDGSRGPVRAARRASAPSSSLALVTSASAPAGSLCMSS